MGYHAKITQNMLFHAKFIMKWIKLNPFHDDVSTKNITAKLCYQLKICCVSKK